MIFFLKYFKIILLFLLAVSFAFSIEKSGRNLLSDTWVATDNLGRTLADQKTAGTTRTNKFVGIFYLTWHGAHGYDEHRNPVGDGQGIFPKKNKKYKSPYDITEILKHEPKKRPWGPPMAGHYWGEPEWGYYLSDDEFVIRKHIQMFADAGIDVIFFDASNGLTYRDVYLKICKVMRKVRESGEKTPQISFLVNAAPEKIVKKLYNEFYRKKLYKELWFEWQGKPLILAPFKNLDKKFLNFFSVRHSWAWSHGPFATSKDDYWFGDGKDRWPWLDYYPQKFGWHENPNTPEQVSVAVASHPMFNIGRSYQNGKQPTEQNFETEKGLHFAEQWKRALEIDPEFIFICEWNEWGAMRIINNGEHKTMCGKPLKKGDSFFVDCYNQEYSRDIEPMKGGHYDSYYFQMIDNIRKFKGVCETPKASPEKSISGDGKFDDWDDVTPEFKDQIGDVFHRNHPGFGRIKSYVNNTGRNDFKSLKVARDDKYIYFFAETVDDITNYKDENWMMIFVDADGNASTGWEGYDYLINRKIKDSHTGSIEKIEKNNKLSKVGKVKFCIKRNKIEIAVPRKFLGLENKKIFTIDFHWADNIQKLFDIVEFAKNGDNAPNRRFKYRYKIK